MEALDGVGRVQSAAMLLGEVQVGEDVSAESSSSVAASGKRSRSIAATSLREPNALE